MLVGSKHAIRCNWCFGLWTQLITHLSDKRDGGLMIIYIILVKLYNMGPNQNTVVCLFVYCMLPLSHGYWFGM